MNPDGAVQAMAETEATRILGASSGPLWERAVESLARAYIVGRAIGKGFHAGELLDAFERGRRRGREIATAVSLS